VTSCNGWVTKWQELDIVAFRGLPMSALCVLNWNAVSLRNSESIVRYLVSYCYLNLKWRASLVPAAAVIPAPLAYTIIVAVKRLVVGLNEFFIKIFLSTLWTNQSASNMYIILQWMNNHGMLLFIMSMGIVGA